MVLQFKSKERNTAFFLKLSRTDRSSVSIGVNEQHSFVGWYHIFLIFYEEMQYFYCITIQFLF